MPQRRVYTTPPWRKANFSETMWWPVSYQALFAKVNGQENTLLAKLIADGAVSQTAAQPLLDKQETYA